MQMSLPPVHRISNSSLQDIRRLIRKLPMQINRIIRDSPIRIVLSEDVIRGLFIILIHLHRMGFRFLRKLVSSSPIATCIGLL